MLLFNRVNCNKNNSNIVFSISWEKLSQSAVSYETTQFDHVTSRSSRILTHETTLTSVVYQIYFKLV
jgi:hypothetical protein